MKNWILLLAGICALPACLYGLPPVFAQDAWSQLLASTQATLFVGLLAAAIATVLSILFGITAGYIGGGTD